MWLRMRARAELLTVLFVMTALLTLALTGSRAYLEGATASALTQTVAGAEPDDRVALVQTRYVGPEQLDTGSSVIAESLPGAHVWAAIRTPPLPLDGHDGQRLTLTDDSRISSAADLVSGEWPGAPGEMAVHHYAAEQLELSTGDAVTVLVDGEPLELALTGTWLPTDTKDTLWGMDPTSRTGVDPSAAHAFGPALISEETIRQIGSAPFIRWQVLPEGLTPETVTAWQRGVAGLVDELTQAEVSSRGIVVSGGLEATLAQVHESLQAVHAVTPIPYSLLTIIGAIAIWQILSLLRLQRRDETAIVRARGGAVAHFARWSVTEGLLVAVPAAACGAGLSLLFGTGSSPWLIAGLIATGVTLMATAAGWPRRRTPGGRLTQVVGTATLALLVGLALFTMWRLLRSGGTLLPGTSRIDLLAVIAPAAVLLAAAALSVAVAGPLLGGLARLATRSPGISPTLEARLAARRGVGAGVVVLLVTLTSTAALATTYWGTWQHLRTTSDQVSAGADLVLDERVTARGLQDLRASTGVQGAAAVLRTPYAAAEGDGEITALSPAAYAATSAPDDVFPPGLSKTLGGERLTGPELPGGSVSGEVTAAVTPQMEIISRWADRSIAVSLLVWDGEVLERVDLAKFEATETATPRPFTADLPGPGPWRAVAVDTLLDVRGNPAEFNVSITIDGADFAGFTPDIIAAPGGTYESHDTLGFTAHLMRELADFYRPGVPTLQRFMYAEPGGPVPVAVTPAWPGAQTTTAIRVAGQEIMAEPVAALPVIPGNPSHAGILADAAALTEALLRAGVSHVRADEIWVAANDPGAVALEIGEDRVRVVSSSWASLSILVPTLLLVMAGLALVLALPAIGAAAMSELRTRRAEVAVLRMVGAGPRTQAWYRRREFIFVFALAIAIGGLAGVGLAWSIAEPLIRSTTPQVSAAVPVTLGIDMPAAAAFAAALAGAGTGVLWWYGRRVAAQVRDPLWREDV